jgi:hypothetical protein
VLLGAGPLHLRQVQVLGRILPARQSRPGLERSSESA